MKKIILTVVMAIAMINANAVNVNTARIAAERISSISLNDSVQHRLMLNDKMKGLKRSFNIDETQEEYLRNVQKSVEYGFSQLDKIEDEKARDAYMNNLIRYWKAESRNAFSNTAKYEWRKDYRRYWMCVNQTLINMKYIKN